MESAADSSSDDPSDAVSRYISPDAKTQSDFAGLVDAFGANRPERWIAAGNPNYAQGDDAWTNNCGSCSRSFANTFQGLSKDAALGDSRKPPGEYEEMWEALGANPTSSYRNTADIDPGDFSQFAYAALKEKLSEMPPGSVVIVGVDWDIPGIQRGHAGGHWFNAYVEPGGVLKWADEQVGLTGDWPPDYSSSIWRLEAVVRHSSDKSWEGVNFDQTRKRPDASE